MNAISSTRACCSQIWSKNFTTEKKVFLFAITFIASLGALIALIGTLALMHVGVLSQISQMQASAMILTGVTTAFILLCICIANICVSNKQTRPSLEKLPNEIWNMVLNHTHNRAALSRVSVEWNWLNRSAEDDYSLSFSADTLSQSFTTKELGADADYLEQNRKHAVYCFSGNLFVAYFVQTNIVQLWFVRHKDTKEDDLPQLRLDEQILDTQRFLNFNSVFKIAIFCQDIFFLYRRGDHNSEKFNLAVWNMATKKLSGVSHKETPSGAIGTINFLFVKNQPLIRYQKTNYYSNTWVTQKLIKPGSAWQLEEDYRIIPHGISTQPRILAYKEDFIYVTAGKKERIYRCSSKENYNSSSPCCKDIGSFNECEHMSIVGTILFWSKYDHVSGMTQLVRRNIADPSIHIENFKFQGQLIGVFGGILMVQKASSPIQFLDFRQFAPKSKKDD